MLWARFYLAMRLHWVALVCGRELPVEGLVNRRSSDTLSFMPRLRNLFLLLIALWLPIQSVVAYAMPFCTHGETGHVAMAQDQPQHDHAVHDAKHNEQGPIVAWANCDQCGVCHLACASFLGTAAMQMAAPYNDHIQHARSPHAVTFPYLARFERPPSFAA